MNSLSALSPLWVLKMYFKNVYPVLSSVNLYSKNVFCVLQCTLVVHQNVYSVLECILEVHQKAVFCFSNNNFIVLKERSAFLNFFICTPRTCTAFVCVPSRYTKKVYRVLQWTLDVHRKPVLRSQAINLYSKNVLCVVQLINLYKNMYLRLSTN